MLKPFFASGYAAGCCGCDDRFGQTRARRDSCAAALVDEFP